MGESVKLSDPYRTHLGIKTAGLLVPREERQLSARACYKDSYLFLVWLRMRGDGRRVGLMAGQGNDKESVSAGPKPHSGQ